MNQIVTYRKQIHTCFDSFLRSSIVNRLKLYGIIRRSLTGCDCKKNHSDCNCNCGKQPFSR